MPRHLRWPAIAAILAILPGQGMGQLPAGTVTNPAAVLPAEAGADWRSLASPRDLERLNGLPGAWAEALEAARADGRMPDVSAAGTLLDSRPGQDGAQPDPGAYRCRVLRLGAADGGPAFTAFPPFRCQVSSRGGLAVFEKSTGSQRIAGTLFPDTPRRWVLIGTEATGNETGFHRYGDDTQRDRIAAVERLGPDRWRLVFPRPPNGAAIEVMELTRATAGPAPPSSPAPARSGTSRRG